MIEACATCNVCTWLPEQKRIRLLRFEKIESPLVLVIDDLYNYDYLGTSLDVAEKLLGGVEYTYTSTIRCENKKVKA